MTREEIIRMAADSNLQLYGLGRDWEKFVATLERFANLVSAEKDKEIEGLEDMILELQERME